MRFLCLIFFAFLLLSSGSEQVQKFDEQIKWMTWDEMVDAHTLHKRKVIVDVYTEWCSWCKVMDKQTFADDTVVQYINENFYAVKLDAEQRDQISWAGQEFKWVANGQNGIHTLAYALCDGKMSYPTLVFLDERLDRITISKGFKDVSTLLKELKFAAEEHYLGDNQSGRSGPTSIMDER